MLDFFKLYFFLLTEIELNPFRSADTWQRLKSNPKTAEYMKDPTFVAGIEEISRNHSTLQKSVLMSF